MFHTQGPKNNNQPSWQESVIRFFNYIFLCVMRTADLIWSCVGWLLSTPPTLMDLMCETWWLCRWISKFLALFVVVGIVPLLALHVERSNKQIGGKNPAQLWAHISQGLIIDRSTRTSVESLICIFRNRVVQLMKAHLIAVAVAVYCCQSGFRKGQQKSGYPIVYLKQQLIVTYWR